MLHQFINIWHILMTQSAYDVTYIGVYDLFISRLKPFKDSIVAWAIFVRNICMVFKVFKKTASLFAVEAFEAVGLFRSERKDCGVLQYRHNVRSDFCIVCGDFGLAANVNIFRWRWKFKERVSTFILFGWCRFFNKVSMDIWAQTKIKFQASYQQLY